MDGQYPYGSQKACMKTCMQHHSLDKCGCTDSTLPQIDKIEHCDMMNASQMCCLDTSLDDLINNVASCNCYLPCVSTNYNKIISHSLWPSQPFFNKKNHTISLMIEDNFNEYKKNHARLNVYYSSLGRLTFLQNPKFLSFELLSYLGGEFGLWLGLSMFALFELCEIIYNLCILCVANFHCNKNL